MVFQSIPREKIIAAIERLGPVQPLDIRRALQEGDTVLLGAILSEMAHGGTVAISRTRRGGSPFYYLPARPETLEQVSQYLNEKDRKTYEIIRERKVVREDSLDPLTRVSLQNIPDFSRRFTVPTENGAIAYWRYYLFPEEEARKRILGEAPRAPEQQAQKPAPPPSPPKEEEEESPRETSLKERQETFSRNDPAWAEDDELYKKAKRFASGIPGTISSARQVRPNQEIRMFLDIAGKLGRERVLAIAYSRKTLPEQLVWKALLEARSEGLPLIVLKDSPFPKSLEKKFSAIPNVYFKRI